MVKLSRNSGFSLVEIIMVLVLIGVLAGVAIPRLVNVSEDARISATTEKLNEFKRALTGDARRIVQGRYVNPGYESHMGSLPNSLTELTTQGAQTAYNPFTQKGWRGPYVSNTSSDWNLDAWGTALVYSKAGRSLTSYGPNRAAGGGDDIVVSF